MRRFLIFLFLVSCASAAADDRTNGLSQFSGALGAISRDRRRRLSCRCRFRPGALRRRPTVKMPRASSLAGSSARASSSIPRDTSSPMNTWSGMRVASASC